MWTPTTRKQHSRNRNRRLTKNFEATIAPARACLYAASVMLLVRKLARDT